MIGRSEPLRAFSCFVILLRNLDTGTGVPYGLGNDDRKSALVISPKDFRFGRYSMPLDLMTLRLVERPVTREEGLRILERDQHRCQYCGLDGAASFENALAMSVDFVIPRARKGKKDERNLVACCRSCNMIKGRRVYRSFEEAKTYVLGQREKLRKAWETRKTAPAAAASASASPKAQKPSAPETSKAAAASVINSSPLSIRNR
jgi:hypothetical protein